MRIHRLSGSNGTDRTVVSARRAARSRRKTASRRRKAIAITALFTQFLQSLPKRFRSSVDRALKRALQYGAEAATRFYGYSQRISFFKKASQEGDLVSLRTVKGDSHILSFA